jgi:chemotaxis protein MotB
MSYAPAQSQTQPPAFLAVSDATAALDCDPETGSGASQQDAWLVSFIDILILLLALFVLLLTHQQDGTGPMEKASPGTADPLIETVAATEPFRLALELPVLLSASDTLAEIFDIEDELAVPSLAGVNSTEAVDSNPPTEERVAEPEIPASPATDDTVQRIEPLATADAGSLDVTPAELQEDQSQPVAETNDTRLTNPDPIDVFLDSFNNSELRDRVEVSVHGGGVNLEISDRILFTPANAALTPSGMAVLEGLADTLKAQPYLLSIEGHTDNSPIKTARFPSNWELSTARAAIVARHLVKQGIPAERIRAIGYADTRPRADNQTPEGRSRNRRVSLLLQVSAGHD